MKVTFTLNKKEHVVEASVSAFKAALSEALKTNDKFYREVVLPVTGKHLMELTNRYAQEHPEILERKKKS